MNRFLTYILLLFFLLFQNKELYATHAAGGELLYELVSGTTDTYRFTFKFYRDCNPGSIREPETVKMCYANQCGVQNRSVILRKISGSLPDGRPNGSPVGTGCISLPTTCAGGSLAGYQEWWYTADVTITDICDNWKFWVSIAARNHAITNLLDPGQRMIYIEAMLNNAVSPENSSPYFSTAPIPYCCIGYPFTYDNGAVDPDGDSLVFESIVPRTGSNNNENCLMPPVDISYTSPFYNAQDNPFATGNSFSVDAATGIVSFTPVIQQVVVITVKVSEYRNGRLIGYVIRDIQIVVNACTTPLTEFAVDPASVQGGVYLSHTLQVASCVGRELRFCYDITSPALSAVLITSDDHELSLAGSSVTYTNMYTDSVRGCVVWPLTPADAGSHTLRVHVRDSGCLPPGFIPSVTYTVPIIISEYFPVYDTVQRTICAGSSYLGHTTAGTYLDTLTSHMGCDSIHTLELSINPVFSHTVADTVCANMLPYRFGTQFINTDGVYTELFSAVTGCDSTVMLSLAIAQPTDSVLNIRICSDSDYEGYTNPGIYHDMFRNAAGCDSVRTINLSWYPPEDTVIHRGICYNESFLGYNQQGIFLDTFPDRHGCDSVRTIHLTVHPLRTETLTRTICPGDTYLGYAQAGVYTDTLVSMAGCDSIRILHLDLSPVLYQTVDTSLCYGATYGGYAASGIYIDTFVSSFQCDSIRTLHLTVHDLPDTIIRMEICAGETFLGYPVAGYYEDVFISHRGCDSTRRLELTVHPVYRKDTLVYICEGDQYYAAGGMQRQAGIFRDSFRTVSGCDSVWITDLRTTPRVYPDLGPDREVCAGEMITLFPGTYKHYYWSTGTTDSRIHVSRTGSYIVTVYDFEGCAAMDTVDILVRELPGVYIRYGEDEICLGDTILLSAAAEALDFQWYQDGAAMGKGMHYSLMPEEGSGMVQVALSGTDRYGCTAGDSVYFYPVSCCGVMYVPNAFTPNGDGLNDQFRVVTTAFFKEFRMMIMDRWGNLVFESVDIKHGWNGMRIQTLADPGVYFYLIRARCYENDKDIVLKGDLTLIR